MKITKEDIGKTIFGVPTGNNARRHCEVGYKIFEVVGMGRKYAKLLQEGSHQPDSYCPETGATQADINSGYGCNAGYKFYWSIEEIEAAKELSELRMEVHRRFNSMASSSKKLNAEQLKQILAWIEDAE